ncbi:Transmembrane protein [Quillaja saponaria]|uniref:Transmembrane protein n=1 Tax=Quillaja saponaria TaxID=32244 RepID=A0AAD7LLM6_QUISA|nr:Transmembrane protein [Quillaja saponaria]
MFLLCNGLLVAIVKNSGLIGNASPISNQRDEHVMGNGDNLPSSVKVLETNTDQKSVEIQEQQNGLSITEDEDEGEDEGNRIAITYEHEDEDEYLLMLSTEELNKRCDDFIRKMKSGFI